MSKSELLYVKGMNMSDSEGMQNGDDDIWDDTQLNNAYDKALKMANIEVAKRIAMSTNNKQALEEDSNSKSKQKSKLKSSKRRWAPGMPCRAVYEGDGIEYEAVVSRLINDTECVVKFLGYDNSEITHIDTLKSSHGTDAQQRQIEQALLDKTGDEDMDMHSDGGNSPGSTVILSERSFKREKKKKRREASSAVNRFQLPDVMSMPMPNFSKLAHMSQMEMPMPPPPLPFLSTNHSDCEEQAISSMLLSWYMSGYHAGLYQGLKRAKDNKRRKD